MLSQLDSLKTEALAALEAAQDETALEAVRVNFLGKKGSVTALSQNMRDVPVDQKKEVGAKLNDVRTAITDGIETKKLALQAALDAKAVEGIDITLPGRPGTGNGEVIGIS
jgi:phenylalanyl-tRNA synthetase alpha chain